MLTRQNPGLWAAWESLLGGKVEPDHCGQRLGCAARKDPGPGEDHEAQGHRWRRGDDPGGPRTPYCSHKCWGDRVGPVMQAVPREQENEDGLEGLVGRTEG